MYSVIDLFAGAGGLSLGFQQTQEYSIKVAFENSTDMQKTYQKNHPAVEVLGNVCTADYSDIQKRYGEIDVVIGGPPCQGFSNANRQKNHAISQNNMLVKQYLRAIIELKPRAFVMENVGMLSSDVHRFYMEKGDEEIIKQYKIPVKLTPLHLLDAEYDFCGAFEVVQDLTQIKQFLWPEKEYKKLNVIFKASKNIEKMEDALKKHRDQLKKNGELRIKELPDGHIKNQTRLAYEALDQYYAGQLTAPEIKERIAPAIMIQRMLSKALEIFENNILVDQYSHKDGISANIRSFAVFDYLKNILEQMDDGYSIDSDVICAADFGAPQKRMRFVVIGIKKSISDEIALPEGTFQSDNYRTVRDAIEDLEDAEPVTELKKDIGIPLQRKENLSVLAQSLRDNTVLRNHIVTDTTPTAMERFQALKQGENFHSLKEELKSNTYTDATRTQNTIYLRLNYDEPSGTVVNVRKSMWIHPTKDRAISVREAARLQTFPDSFVFCGSKDKQYQQVGNAVPPILAKAIAQNLARVLGQRMPED